MRLPNRRQFLNLAAGAAGVPAMPRIARAQAYPSRPVRIIVGFPAGGPTDIAARLMSQWLSERLGQQFVVDNRPGAGGNIATEAVVRAPADGYTLLSLGSQNAINATLYDKLNFIRDIAPVSGIIREPLIIEVHPSFPAKTLPEFIAYAKANPGMINMASAGNGTASHLVAEGHARRDRRQAQQRGQRRFRRPHDQGAACRPGWRGACGLARRLQQPYC